jgi:hypothetical protein
MINTKIASLNIEEFAALPAVWPESLALGDAMLIARIDPACNRSQGDEDVLVRALVFDRRQPSLRRLTIRKQNLIPRALAEDHIIDHVMIEYAADYAKTLQAVLSLPMLNLSN